MEFLVAEQTRFALLEDPFIALRVSFASCEYLICKCLDVSFEVRDVQRNVSPENYILRTGVSSAGSIVVSPASRCSEGRLKF